MDPISQCRSLQDITTVLVVLAQDSRYPRYPNVEDFNIRQRPVTVHDFAELSNEHYFGVMTIYRGKSMQLVTDKNGYQNL